MASLASFSLASFTLKVVEVLVNLHPAASAIRKQMGRIVDRVKDVSPYPVVVARECSAPCFVVQGFPGFPCVGKVPAVYLPSAGRMLCLLASAQASGELSVVQELLSREGIEPSPMNVIEFLVLHEVGHAVSFSELTSRYGEDAVHEFSESMEAADALFLSCICGDISRAEAVRQYRSLPLEAQASAWAISFMKGGRA